MIQPTLVRCLSRKRASPIALRQARCASPALRMRGRNPIPMLQRRSRRRLRSPQIGSGLSSIRLPEGPFEAAGGIVINVEAASAYSTLIESGGVAQLSDPLSRVGGYVAQTVDSQDFLRAQRIRRVLQQKMDTVFQQCDVLVAPSLPVPASTLDTNLETDLSFADPIGGIGNLCGLPAVSVPCGFTKSGLADRHPVPCAGAERQRRRRRRRDVSGAYRLAPRSIRC